MPPLDRDVFELVNHTGAWPPVDKLMAVMSSFAFWMPILGLGALLFVLFGGTKGRLLVVVLVVVVGLTEGLIVNLLKALVHRPRPAEALAHTRIVALAKVRPQFRALFRPPAIGASADKDLRQTGNSFPSGHVTDNFAALAVLVAFFRWRGSLYAIPASLVAYSRIYVGKHWPSDVLFSVFLGIACAVLLMMLMNGVLKLTRRGRAWRQAIGEPPASHRLRFDRKDDGAGENHSPAEPMMPG